MKNKLITSIYVSFLSLTACSPVLYSSLGQNTPLFHEKGEVTASAGYCEIYDAKGLNLQFATAATDKLAVIASLYSMKSFTTSSDEVWYGKGMYFEAGVGKYGYSPENKWNYELIGGVGYGALKNKIGNETVNANYIKPFFQPSFGISGGIVEFALTPRIGLVTYVSHFNSVADSFDRSQVETYFDEKSTTLVFEPGATLRVGYRNVKLQAQYVYSTFNYEDEDGMDPVNPEFISIGLHVLITNRFKKN